MLVFDTCVQKFHILVCGTGNAASTRQSKTSDLVVGAERVEPDTEFVILASSGIWEVRLVIIHPTHVYQKFFHMRASHFYKSSSLHLHIVILQLWHVFQVMKNQEAVNLIKHIENPQAASECLAKEASNRMSRGSISCLVIRFD